MKDNINDLINYIENISHNYYTLLVNDVNYIIDNEIKNINDIEKVIDFIIDYSYINENKANILFEEIINYYTEISKENAKEYIKIYRRSKNG